MFAYQKMKNLDKILLFLTILIVVFNLTQLNIYNFLDDENRIALICFILSLCALILILILMISKKIRDKEFNHEDKDLIDFLYDLTEEKIKIDNPRYK